MSPEKASKIILVVSPDVSFGILTGISPEFLLEIHVSILPENHPAICQRMLREIPSEFDPGNHWAHQVVHSGVTSMFFLPRTSSRYYFVTNFVSEFSSYSWRSAKDSYRKSSKKILKGLVQSFWNKFVGRYVSSPFYPRSPSETAPKNPRGIILGNLWGFLNGFDLWLIIMFRWILF